MGKKTYTFAVKPIRRGAKKNLTIDASKSLSELDGKIRKVMGYDTWDHLSGFYEGKPFRSNEIATISPDGCGENSNAKIGSLNFQLGDKFGYVYDFGDSVESMIFVENIT
jgi:hypothetical protein